MTRDQNRDRFNNGRNNWSGEPFQERRGPLLETPGSNRYPESPHHSRFEGQNIEARFNTRNNESPHFNTRSNESPRYDSRSNGSPQYDGRNKDSPRFEGHNSGGRGALPHTTNNRRPPPPRSPSSVSRDHIEANQASR